jgi:hypothetical protein
VLGGVPLLGAAFALPGGGRAGFALLALLWAACLLALPTALAERPQRSGGPYSCRP